MNKNKTLSTKINAAICLQNLVSIPHVRELIKVKIPEILKTFILLINRYDIELLYNSFESTISEFNSEIGPYAEELILCLITIAKDLL